MEWSEENKYNSFNSEAKGLTFYEHYKSINDWRIGKIDKPLPPIEVSFDPIHRCNLNCLHPDSEITMSNFSKKKIKDIVEGDEILGMKHLPTNIMKLVPQKVIKKWITEPKKCVEVSYLEKLICSEDHELYSTRSHRYTKAINCNDSEGKYFSKWNYDKNNDYKKGYLCGAFYGDGWIGEYISFGVTDKEFVLRIKEYISDLIKKDIKIYEYRKTSINNQVYDLRIDDKEVKFILTNWYLDNEEFFRGFMAGFFDAEGSWGNNSLSICQTKDFTLLKKLCEKLNNVNIFAKIKERKTNIVKSGIVYNIHIGHSNVERCNFFAWCDPVLKRKLKIWDNLYLQKTKLSIKENKYDGELIEIETETHNYFANGLLVHNCSWCNASRYLDKGLQGKRMTDEHMLNLIYFLSEWGVKALCFGGGGESLLHTKLNDALNYSYELGLENSIATNGTIFTDELIITAINTCRWIGVSIDSATKETYFKARKIDLFDKAIDNLCKLVKENKENKCDITYKFLIFQENQHEIYDACKLAKEIGVNTFHCRPASYIHQGMKETINNPYNIELIEEQFKKCRELEDKNFKVYLIVHKFNPDFSTRRDFKQCWTGPICIQLCADGNVYNCPDSRHLEEFKLGEHYPSPEKILEFWGSKKHYNLVFDGACKICNWRCTFGYYNKMFEKLFIDNNDPLCRNFV
jgi:pyruvate-formate lyase-activating enzyme/DNA-binding transcriptional regulator WhiA